MSDRRTLSLLALLGPTVALTAHAEIYLTSEQAVAAIFPGHAMARSSVTLQPADIERVEKESGQSVRLKNLTLWHDKDGNTVYVDQVLGKHEFITIAVGIDPAGKVKGIEILEYRETYGQQVREAAWKNQFADKSKASALKLGDDIKNIAGATLSSLHVTNGVKRLLVTHDVFKNRI